jgi:anti-sigma regulatory factor (Ser/Thr protein kinase)
MTGFGHAWREIALPDGLQAPAVARRWLLDGIAADLSAMVETAALLVSELVTNAVVHGQPAVTARMRDADGTIEVAVRDCGEPIAAGVAGAEGNRPDTHQPGGRGLFIVSELASEWGIRPLRPGPGKAVWFRLHRQP